MTRLVRLEGPETVCLSTESLDVVSQVSRKNQLFSEKGSCLASFAKELVVSRVRQLFREFFWFCRVPYC